MVGEGIPDQSETNFGTEGVLGLRGLSYVRTDLRRNTALDQPEELARRWAAIRRNVGGGIDVRPEAPVDMTQVITTQRVY